MNRKTKRTVGWGAGVAIATALIVLTFVLILAFSSGGEKLPPDAALASAATAEDEAGH